MSESLHMRRLKRQMGIRLFCDQLEDLAKIRSLHFRDRCGIAYLIRLAVDQYIETELRRRNQLPKILA